MFDESVGPTTLCKAHLVRAMESQQAYLLSMAIV